MILRSLCTVLAMGALAVLGASRAAPQTRYSISEILVPSLPDGGGYAEIAAINNKGQMVGTAYVPDGKGSYLKHAYLWNNVIALRDLGTLPGGKSSGASAINNLGQVVGWSESATLDALGNAHLRHAFVWDAVNGMRDLGVLPDVPKTESFAIGINDAGQALIRGQDPFFSYHAALWDSSNGLQDIGLPPGYAPGFYPTLPIALNNKGHALISDYLWAQQAGWANLLDVIGDQRVRLAALNDSGQTAGLLVLTSTGEGGYGDTLPVYWDAKRGLVTISTLFGAATRLNNSAQVIGTVQAATGSEGFLWDPAGGFQDLLSLTPPVSNWTNLFPAAINDKAQIAGDGWRQWLGDTAISGGRFLMTPDANQLTLSLKVSHVVGGTLTQGVVTLQNPAPAGGLTLPLASSNTALVRVHVKVTIPAGATSVTFPVVTQAVPDFHLVAVVTKYSGVIAAAVLSVTPPADKIAIQSAVYTGDTSELSVEAGSSSNPAYMTVTDADTGDDLGVLSSTGNGHFSASFVVTYIPRRITVTSNLNGTASRDVDVR